MEERTDPPVEGTPGAPRRRWIAAAVLLLLAAMVVVLLQRASQWRPRLTSEEASQVVLAQLQRESRQAFVVTGQLDMTVTTRIRNVRRLLPGLLDVSLGTVESTVRAPGRVSYGFDLSGVRAEAIQIRGDTVEMRIPAVRVYAVEPNLQRMEVQTSSGWLRARDGTESQVQKRATALLIPALRRQAQQHLKDSEQPRINTAETLAQMLAPALVSAGMEKPVFRFIINESLVHTGTPDR